MVLVGILVSVSGPVTPVLANDGPPAPGDWGKNNFHVIEEDSTTGFAIYRTSKPGRGDMRGFCQTGITEMMVLSGTADNAEYKYADECPTLKVIYNVKQDDKVPLDGKFLSEFDAWVTDAKAKGKKIAFRCECGCHRTGRLAAYYQLKYQHLALGDTLNILKDNGHWMALYPHIRKQVIAINDYVRGRECTISQKYCIKP